MNNTDIWVGIAVQEYDRLTVYCAFKDLKSIFSF